MKICFYLSFGITTQRLLTRRCNLEAIIFESSHFCHSLFEGHFTITQEWVTRPKLPKWNDYGVYAHDTFVFCYNATSAFDYNATFAFKYNATFVFKYNATFVFKYNATFVFKYKATFVFKYNAKFVFD